MTDQYLWTDNPTESGIAKCDTDVLNDCLMHLKYENQPVELIQDVEDLKVDKANINADNFTSVGVQSLIENGLPNWSNKALLNLSQGMKYTVPKDGIIHFWHSNRGTTSSISIAIVGENSEIIQRPLLYSWHMSTNAGFTNWIFLKKNTILQVDEFNRPTNSSITVYFVPFEGVL